MNKIVIIHGIGGIEKEPYFPHLKERCEQLGIKVFMPSLGSYRENITYEKWKDYFDKNILPFIDKDTIVVGQSLGTQFAIKYLVEKDLDVRAYISCAGPYDVLEMKQTAPERAFSFAPVSSLFKPTEEEFSLFGNKKFPKYSLFCDNDTFFEQNNLEKYSKAINSVPVFINGKGHFNILELNELEELIEKIINKK